MSAPECGAKAKCVTERKRESRGEKDSDLSLEQEQILQSVWSKTAPPHWHGTPGWMSIHPPLNPYQGGTDPGTFLQDFFSSTNLSSSVLQTWQTFSVHIKAYFDVLLRVESCDIVVVTHCNVVTDKMSDFFFTYIIILSRNKAATSSSHTNTDCLTEWNTL